MRVLKPEVAQKRKENILNWVIHKYVTTGRPISSELICEEGKFDISSATIRNILKELEDDGFLNQVHTSGGRVPSDKGYRAYVDSLKHFQSMAESEKERLEMEYDRKMEQLDYFLKNTSKILADVSHMAGFTIFSDLTQETLKRLDVVKISNKNYLSILITDANIIKHMPFMLEKIVEKNILRTIVAKLNKNLKGLPIYEIRNRLASAQINASESEKAVYEALVKVIDEIKRQEDSFYLEGLSAIFANSQEYEYEDLVNIARLLEEKDKFSAILRERLKESSQIRQISQGEKGKNKRTVEVTIGTESSLKEFKNFSMVSSSYCLKDKAVGLVGVIGYKRMEYPKVISIVDAVSSMMENALSEWEDFEDEEF